RLDCLVTAGLAPDCPRHARIARFSSDRIVSPFAIRMADRMNRREKNYVEAHFSPVIPSRQTIAKCRSTIAAAFSRARKKFVPGRNLRFLALDNHPRWRHVLRRPRTVRISRHQHFELARMDDVIDL